MSQELGSFCLGADNLISGLASAISGKKPRFVEIRKDGERYVVSSVSEEELPDNLKILRTDKITKNNVDAALFTSAQLIHEGVGKRYFFKRAGQNARLDYEYLRED